MPGFRVAIIPVTAFAQNCTVLFEQESRQAVVFDPGGDADRIMEMLTHEGLDVQHILLTHGHLDHAGGATALQAALTVPGKPLVEIWGPDARDRFLLEVDRAAASAVRPVRPGQRHSGPLADRRRRGGIRSAALRCAALPGPHAGQRGLCGTRRPFRHRRRCAVPGLGRPHRFPLRRPRRADCRHHRQTAAAGRRHRLHQRPWRRGRASARNGATTRSSDRLRAAITRRAACGARRPASRHSAGYARPSPMCGTKRRCSAQERENASGSGQTPAAQPAR